MNASQGVRRALGTLNRNVQLSPAQSSTIETPCLASSFGGKRGWACRCQQEVQAEDKNGEETEAEDSDDMRTVKKPRTPASTSASRRCHASSPSSPLLPIVNINADRLSPPPSEFIKRTQSPNSISSMRRQPLKQQENEKERRRCSTYKSPSNCHGPTSISPLSCGYMTPHSSVPRPRHLATSTTSTTSTIPLISAATPAVGLTSSSAAASTVAISTTMASEPTGEDARKKVEVLKLRLGLAGYKLRTGQENIPLERLRVIRPIKRQGNGRGDSGRWITPKRLLLPFPSPSMPTFTDTTRSIELESSFPSTNFTTPSKHANAQQPGPSPSTPKDAPIEPS